MEFLNELIAGAGYPRADCPDGAFADDGGIGVGEPQELGEHEGGAPVGIEPGQRLLGQD
jgi:hypothetical protein